MQGTLQEQLIKLGLADKNQARSTKTKNRPKFNAKSSTNRRRKDKSSSSKVTTTSTTKHQRQQFKTTTRFSTAVDTREHDQTKQTTLSIDKKTRSAHPVTEQDKKIRKHVHQLIFNNQRNNEHAEVPFNFIKGTYIRRIYVTPEQRQALTKNELAIAAAKGKHYIIPIEIADEITKLIPEYYICRPNAPNENSSSAGEGSAIPSEQASTNGEYGIPDDLVW